MKKIIYGCIALIIIVGIAIIAITGLNADITYSKNATIDIYIGKTIEINDIKQITDEVFPNERVIIQKIELFEDMISIKIKDRTDEELKTSVEQLNAKINERYEIENTVEEITVTHNPKTRLSSLITPYILPIGISTLVILIFVGIKYKKQGTIKVVLTYLLSVIAVELLFLSVLAITRFPVNRLVIPIGLVLYISTITALSLRYEAQGN